MAAPKAHTRSSYRRGARRHKIKSAQIGQCVEREWLAKMRQPVGPGAIEFVALGHCAWAQQVKAAGHVVARHHQAHAARQQALAQPG